MSTTEFYEHILRTMPEGLEQKVFQALLSHVGCENKITLGALCEKTLGRMTVTAERQVREAIEGLRKDYCVAVISESGQAGRWLAKDFEEVERCIAEMESRRNNLGAVIQSLRHARVPETRRSVGRAASQAGLWW